MKNMPTMIPYLTVTDSKKSVDFYEKAFGFTWENPNEGLNHIEMSYQDVMIMFAPEGAFGGITKAPITQGAECSMNLYLYCTDVDKVYNRAMEAGAISCMNPQDAFWGDRVCQVKDPDGFMWMFAKKLSS